METLIPARLTTLGHPQRLALFRLLMRRYPDSLPAGEIAEALGLKPSTLSAYLSALLGVGLITQSRAGTSLRYAADIAGIRDTFGYLLNDCCRGRPDLCATLPGAMPQAAAPRPGRRYGVLFLCTGNSARSIMAETLLRDLAGDRFDACSAGTRPQPVPHPEALRLLADKGHDTAPLRAKSLAAVTGPAAPRFDFIFTLCNQAANEACPAWEGQPMTGHWGMADPARASGTAAERALAFRQAYATLKRRIEAFAALPHATLDRIALQSAVDDIGRTPMETHA